MDRDNEQNHALRDTNLIQWSSMQRECERAIGNKKAVKHMLREQIKKKCKAKK